MFSWTAFPARLRLWATAAMARLGLRDDAFLVVVAILVGIVTGAAAVGFHSLIKTIRDHLYSGLGSRVDLYGGPAILMLIFLPMAGGLAVGVISRYVFRAREGHGVADVIESVVRSRGVIRPVTSLEKILTSGITIGTGGSAGAEGPIIQIGAGIASGIGQLFRIARQHMPILIGCGAAAGISAIFNSPIGGVLFTLEVILQDFSIRTFTPVVLASVIANVTTKAVFGIVAPHEPYEAIFAMPPFDVSNQADLTWSHLGAFLSLGLLCGLVGVTLTRAMYWAESFFPKLPLPRAIRPGVGGALLGVLGVLFVVTVGWWMLGRSKPIEFSAYPLPAFYSDGYGVIRQLVSSGSHEAASTRPDGAEGRNLYRQYDDRPRQLLALLVILCVVKVLATSVTLGSGGSGGIIAPSLFLGATAGGALGVVLRHMGLNVEPNVYAMVGMGAVLAAVVHAPLASILIVHDLTHDYKIILPVMLAAIVATGTARLIFRDSVYTLTLRLRGVRVGTMADLTMLRRLSVEQVSLTPACMVSCTDPFQKILDLMAQSGATDFVVRDEAGHYMGMVVAEDIKTALMEREAVPLLLTRDLVRADVPIISNTDDLASVLDVFSRHDISHLPVGIGRDSDKIAGLISRASLMRRYQKGLAEG